MKLPISTINVGERTRLDLGDIAGLAASIEALGLLHPVVITASRDLIAGERRLAALRSLGWTEIPVTVVGINNAADALRAELEENTCRRSLSAYEADVLRQKRELVLAQDAKRRQREGQEKGRAAQREPVSRNLRETSDSPIALPGMPEPPKPIIEADEPRSRETSKVAAIGTGYSSRTLDKVRTIRDAAERGVVKQGRTEIPAPAPVQEAARAAVEEIKRSGVAVESAVASVNDAIDTHIPKKPEERHRPWRKKFLDTLSRLRKVMDFRVEDAETHADDECLDELDRLIADLTSYRARLRVSTEAEVIPMRGRAHG